MSPNIPKTEVSSPSCDECRQELSPSVAVCSEGGPPPALPARRRSLRTWLVLGILLACLSVALFLSRAASPPDTASPTAASSLLSRLKDSLLTNLLLGHESAVYSLAFSPDGQTLASAGADKTIILWDVPGRRLRETLTPVAKIACLAFSPDGTTLAVGTWDGLILRWDAQTWQSLGPPLTGHTDAVYHLAFSPDGRILASASGDGTIILREFPGGRPLGPPLRGHSQWVAALAFSPDGKILASAGGDGQVILWEVASRQSLGPPLQGHRGPVLVVAFSLDGAVVASGGDDQRVILWDSLTRQVRGILPQFGAAVMSLAFSPDGQTLAVGTLHETIFLWHMAAQQVIGSPLSRHEAAVLSLAFSPDGRILASAGEDKTVILWDLGKRSWLLQAYNAFAGEWRRRLGGLFSRRLERDQPRPEPQVERAGK